MKVGITVEVRCSAGSVAFQSQIDSDQDSMRFVRKELQPGQEWSFRILPIERDKIAFFAAQSLLPATLKVNGSETILEGQNTTDFGVFFARRDLETIGSLPFAGDLTEIKVTNDSDKKNRFDIFLGEVPEPVSESVNIEAKQPDQDAESPE